MNRGEGIPGSFYPGLVLLNESRHLGAGCIVGSGTISNKEGDVGSSCLAEKRMLEKIETGEFTTPFMRWGDRVRIEMFNEEGESLFGAIDQEVVEYASSHAGAYASR